MNQVRTFLLFAWLLVGFLIWEAWQRDYALPSAPADSADSAVPTIADMQRDPGEVPAVPAVAGVEPPTGALEIEAAQDPVVVETDLLRLTFDPRGASLVRAELLAHAQEAEAGSPPVALLSTTPGQAFVAQAGWLQPDEAGRWAGARSLQTHEAAFAVDRSTLSPPAADGRIEIPFRWTDPVSGATLERRWVIERGSYVLGLRDRWSNAAGAPLALAPYRELLREPPPSKGGGFTNPEAYSFVGAAWFSPDAKFNKLKFDDFVDEPLRTSATDGWIAMLQHYFFAAWIPAAGEQTIFSTSQLGRLYRIRAVGSALTVAPGADATHETRLYVGPKLQDELAAVAPGLERTIDYGVLTVLAEPLFWLLSLFHGLVGNWGWAIVMLVVLIKAVFFKLSEAQYKSFAKMRRVQPRIESLKERYGDDRAKFNAAMMDLYKKEKINPMGGCLPILVQIPVFISLYWVLLESVELRHAPWFGWIDNLTAPDPYFILPVLNLLTMWLTQKLSPAPGMDPVQRRMMQAMPLVFGVLFAFFPAGLVLYWTVNGALGLLQQWVITRRHGEPAAKA